MQPVNINDITFKNPNYEQDLDEYNANVLKLNVFKETFPQLDFEDWERELNEYKPLEYIELSSEHKELLQLELDKFHAELESLKEKAVSQEKVLVENVIASLQV